MIQETTERKVTVRHKRKCRFCGEGALPVDYRDVKLLSTLISERGKILPRRLTGVCAKHQRKVTREIKKARVLALLPFTTIYR